MYLRRKRRNSGSIKSFPLLLTDWSFAEGEVGRVEVGKKEDVKEERDDVIVNPFIVHREDRLLDGAFPEPYIPPLRPSKLIVIVPRSHFDFCLI